MVKQFLNLLKDPILTISPKSHPDLTTLNQTDLGYESSYNDGQLDECNIGKNMNVPQQGQTQPIGLCHLM